MRERFQPYQILIVVGLASLLKFLVGTPDLTPFNSDEAIVALMAKHINQGSIPTFFYGQAYMGSLDAMIVSVGFKIFGEAVWVIRLVQSLLYLGTIITVMLITVRILGSVKSGFVAGLLMALPPVNITLYSTVSLGGYGEMLLIGNMLLLAGLPIFERIRDHQRSISSEHYLGVFFWGLGAGFAFWVFGLSLIYTIPSVVFFLVLTIRFRPKTFMRTFFILLAGGLIGSSPWWSEIFLSGDLSVFAELAGGAIRNASTGVILLRPLKRLANLIVFGGTVMIGLRPPWDVRWLMLPILPFVMIFWMAVLSHSLIDLNRDRQNLGKWLLSSMGITLVIGFLFTPYGDDPSGRYFLPLITPMVIFAADLLASKLQGRKLFMYSILTLVLVYNLGGTIQSILKNPPGLSTQFDKVAQVDHRSMEDLIVFLNANQIRTGYTNYWVAYPLAFLSNEQIIFLPRLPYHLDFRYTARDDRYPPYRKIVESSDQIAFITTNHPDLDAYLREEFTSLGMNWEEEKIGDFNIFYGLSELIYIEQIGLGMTTEP